MTTQATTEIISDYICTEILKDPDHTLDLTANLFASGQIDSVGIMRLIRFLEDTLELVIPPGDLIPDNFRTVEVMANYLDELRSRLGQADAS